MKSEGLRSPCLSCERKDENGNLLLHGDKNIPICRACRKPGEYVKALGGAATSSVPVEACMDGGGGGAWEKTKVKLSELSGPPVSRLDESKLEDQGEDLEHQEETDAQEVEVTKRKKVDALIEGICDDNFVGVAAILAGTRTVKASTARRQIIERLMSAEFEVPQAEIAKLVGVTYSAVNLVVTNLKKAAAEKVAPPTQEEIFEDSAAELKEKLRKREFAITVDFGGHKKAYERLGKEATEQLRTVENQVLYILTERFKDEPN